MSKDHFVPIILRDINAPWERVLSLGKPVFFPKHTILQGGEENSRGPGMFYILSGRIRLSFLAVNGQEKFLFYMGKGVLFNEMPMFLQTYPSLAFFSCMENVHAVFLSKKLFTLDFIRKNPDLALNMISSLTLKARNFHAQLCSIGIHDAFTNVCRILYSMYLFNQDNGKIVPWLTQQEFAAILGIHRSTLHGALSRLRAEGIIGKYCRNLLEINDVEQLYCYTIVEPWCT